MLVKTETAHDVSPKALAKSLADAEPSEFADFWFAFHEVCVPEKLDEFARAMIPDIGSSRKRPLKELCMLMEYHSISAQRNK